MNDPDDMIAQACGVPRERFACGCVRPFSMGFGYRDPQAICLACRSKRERRGCIVAVISLAVALVIFAVLARCQFP